MIVDELKFCNINFVIVKDYEIIDIFSEGVGICYNFKNINNEMPSKQELSLVVVSVNTGVIDKINSESIFCYYLINKNIDDIVTFLSPDNEMIELKIKDIIIK